MKCWRWIFGRRSKALQPRFLCLKGQAARKMISILIESWDKVDQSDKDQLWLNIKNYWHIPNDYHKSQVLADCCTQWRQYMSRLLYLRDIGENPLLEYTFLDEKMYRDFVVLKSTKQFQEKRRKGKELVKINKNPVRLGKSGYHGKEAEWAKEDEAGVTIKGHHISSERIFARRKRDSSGALRLPPAIEPLTDEFIEKDIQASQGVLEIGHRSDLLIEVLGPEHSGRTRAVGHNIGPTKSGIYERRRKKYESRDTEANMSDNMYEKLKTRLMADMVDDIVPVVVAALKKDGTNVRSKTSTTVLDELHKMTKDKRPPSVPTQTACIHCDKAESEISLYSFEAADLLQAASLCSSFSHSLLNVERKPAKIKLRQSLSPASEVRP